MLIQSSRGPKSIPVVEGCIFDKYGSCNPLHQFLMRRFLEDACDLFRSAHHDSVLEVGCGPGKLAARLWPDQTDFGAQGVNYVGVDISQSQCRQAQKTCPSSQFLVGSASQLPFPNQSFDLVVACEVLEHLENPLLAIDEAARVCRFGILASVPWEPIWKGLNLARGAYWSSWGNTPGHLQAFSRRGFHQLIERRFQIIATRNPFPWSMVLARKRQL